MNKKYIVRLSGKERRTLQEVVRKLQGSSLKVRRAQVLLKADVAGPAWTDERIAEAFGCRTRTVEKLRERFVSDGFEQTLHGKRREKPATPKLLNGKQEAQVIALRLGPSPKGYANWSLRLLARKLVELEVVPAISYETVRGTLKKTV
jgi:AraC-like DNA-binding protein